MRPFVGGGPGILWSGRRRVMPARAHRVPAGAAPGGDPDPSTTPTWVLSVVGGVAFYPWRGLTVRGERRSASHPVAPWRLASDAERHTNDAADESSEISAASATGGRRLSRPACSFCLPWCESSPLSDRRNSSSRPPRRNSPPSPSRTPTWQAPWAGSTPTSPNLFVQRLVQLQRVPAASRSAGTGTITSRPSSRSARRRPPSCTRLGRSTSRVNGRTSARTHEFSTGGWWRAAGTSSSGNAWAHPHVAAGVDLTWETHEQHDEPILLFDSASRVTRESFSRRKRSVRLRASTSGCLPRSGRSCTSCRGVLPDRPPNHAWKRC